MEEPVKSTKLTVDEGKDDTAAAGCCGVNSDADSFRAAATDRFRFLDLAMS